MSTGFRSLFSPDFQKIAIYLHLMFLLLPIAQASDFLKLEDYLAQVKHEHLGFQGSMARSQGGELRSQEGKTLLAPTAFTQIQYTQDGRITPGSFIGYDHQKIKTFSFGVSQLTSFGLQAKLHYDIVSQSYIRPVLLFPGFDLNSSFIRTSSAYASPVLELTQSLWSNGWGSSTRATQEQIESQALASSYNARFAARSELTQAEIYYWNLALARQNVFVQTEALDRAQKIYSWSVRRVKLHLADQSDAMQAEALLQTRELDLMTAKDLARNAARSFNSLRHLDSDDVKEILATLDAQTLKSIELPTRASMRDDVKAAEQNTKSAIAAAKIAIEKNKPTLDVFANLTLNGQPSSSLGVLNGYLPYTDLSDAMSSSFSFNRPTAAVGLKFSLPLDLSTLSKSQKGWQQERQAAELLLDQKLFEQEQAWKELQQSLNETRKRLIISQKLEVIQESKLKNERKRLQSGRTTTYQVLLFEEDFLLSQLGRIREQAKLLTLIAQMKLFGESS